MPLVIDSLYFVYVFTYVSTPMQPWCDYRRCVNDGRCVLISKIFNQSSTNHHKVIIITVMSINGNNVVKYYL